LTKLELLIWYINKEDIFSLAHTIKPDNLALKSVLRFLLPPSWISLRSKYLLSLLCLDWLNKKVGLGLELESYWISGITSSNVIVFLRGWINVSADDEADLAELEAPVMPAMKEASRLGDK
jgi:hypothetical protein